ncbi:MAG: hypothetical protein ACRDLN_04570 [Solirubrobacteraceae bacterium]
MTMTQATVAVVGSGQPEAVPATSPGVVDATFYGVLGVRPPYATSSGVEAFVGCHALNCYN